MANDHSDSVTPTSAPRMTRDADTIPTKELLKAQRKRDYEAAKAKRKSDRFAAKAERVAVRAANREVRDQEIWTALKRGDELGAPK